MKISSDEFRQATSSPSVPGRNLALAFMAVSIALPGRFVTSQSRESRKVLGTSSELESRIAGNGV